MGICETLRQGCNKCFAVTTVKVDYTANFYVELTTPKCTNTFVSRCVLENLATKWVWTDDNAVHSTFPNPESLFVFLERGCSEGIFAPILSSSAMLFFNAT